MFDGMDEAEEAPETQCEPRYEYLPLIDIPDPQTDDQRSFCFLCFVADSKLDECQNIRVTNLLMYIKHNFGTMSTSRLVRDIFSIYNQHIRPDMEGTPVWSKATIAQHLYNHNPPLWAQQIIDYQYLTQMKAVIARTSIHRRNIDTGEESVSIPHVRVLVNLITKSQQLNRQIKHKQRVN